MRGAESEIKEWFKTINIAGIPLNEQELSNAIHSGPFVTKAKEEFSNSSDSMLQKWSAYVAGNVLRQDYLRTVLDWVSIGKFSFQLTATSCSGAGQGEERGRKRGSPLAITAMPAL